MRGLLIFLPGLISLSAVAQLTIVPIAHPARSSARIEQSFAVGDTLMELPFWDDFSQSTGVPDTTLWQNSENVFINNTLSINQPTQNVATFDGITRLGRPYQPSATFTGAGDSLVSIPINLTSVPESRRNTVFLSFFWQLKGNGELPDEGDSLRLEFLTMDSVWLPQDINGDEDGFALTGGIENLAYDEDSLLSFRQIIIPVNNAWFFHEGFKFKFQSFSNLSGIYDTWHIDYIYLNQDRTITDRSHFDRSFSSQPTLLFDPYYEIPAHQFRKNPGRYITMQTAYGSNLDDQFFPMEVNHILTNLTTNQFVTSDFDFKSTLQPFELGKAFSGISLDGLNIAEDSVVLESKFIFKSGDKNLFEVVGSNDDTLFLPVDLKINDTLTTSYTLHNYYAYDDGTAEFAAGINLIGGEIAVAFYLEEPDTLTDILIHFPAVTPSSDGQAIDIKVWSKLSEDPVEGLLHLQPAVIQNGSRDEFQQITLSPVMVSDTFFVGYRQFTNNYIGIGFDRNNTGGMSNIYTNTDRKWDQNNRLEGSLMIRPVFRSSDDFVLGTNPEHQEFKVYPNPVSDKLHITGHHHQIEILTVSGQSLYLSSGSETHDLSHLPNGLYLLRIFANTGIYTHRIIIRR